MHIKIYMENILYIYLFLTPKVPYYDCQYCLICFIIKDSEIRWLQICLIDFEVTFIYLSYFEICWLQIVLNLF